LTETQRPVDAFGWPAEHQLLVDLLQVGERRQLVLRRGPPHDVETVYVDGGRGVAEDEPEGSELRFEGSVRPRAAVAGGAAEELEQRALVLAVAVEGALLQLLERHLRGADVGL